MSDTEEDRPQTKPFAQFLREHKGGALHDEISRELCDLVQAVATTGKQGSITITLKVAPMKAQEGVFEITDDVKPKLPVMPRKGSMFFSDDHGNLFRDNPNQQRIPGVMAVPDSDETPVDLNAKTAEPIALTNN